MNDAFASPQTVLVLGGTSEIARATVRALVAGRTRVLVLAGRDQAGLDQAGAEAKAAGATTVETVVWDATDVEGHGEALGKVFAAHGDVDLVLMAVGVLGDQAGDEADPASAARVITSNFAGPAAACLVVAEHLRAQGHGTLVILSSVAGERVRRANFIYGSSKAGLDGFAQGLGDSLVGSGARVMVVRPGFVRTRMTAGMKEAPFTTTADAVATAVVDGLRRGKETVWVPPALRAMMIVARHLPRSAFRKLPR